MRSVRWRVAGVALMAAAGACGQETTPRPAAAPAPRGAAPAQAGSAVAAGIPVVGLAELAVGRPEVAVSARNPFQFGISEPSGPGPRPVVTGPSSGAAQGGASRPAPGAGAPSRRSIPLKFIGLVDGDTVGKVAVLSDGSFVYHGRTGEIIEGRYRIVRIGVESLQIEPVDGGSRRTIRLSGS